MREMPLGTTWKATQFTNYNYLSNKQPGALPGTTLPGASNAASNGRAWGFPQAQVVSIPSPIMTSAQSTTEPHAALQDNLAMDPGDGCLELSKDSEIDLSLHRLKMLHRPGLEVITKKPI